MRQHRFQKGQVGGYAANAVFAQRPLHPHHCFFGGGGPGGDFFQQRIVMARHHGAGIGGAAIHPDAKTESAAIGGDAAIIGNKVVLGILSGDAALNGMTAEADLGLRRDAGLVQHADMFALGNADLRLDDVQAGDHFGHGMLDLDARIDFDEIEFPAIAIHQEFHRAGADIIGRLADAQRRLRHVAARLVGNPGGGGALDHFLVAALDGAVALEQMHQIAVMVAQDLHFDMAGPGDELFEIDFVFAESSLGFTPCHAHSFNDAIRIGQRAHATSAAAPAGFQHHGIADALGQLFHGFRIVGQRRGGRHHRHFVGDGEISGRNLVAQIAHGLGRRADEDDAGFSTSFRQFRAFRQEAITGMNGIHLGRLGHGDDICDGQIGLDRAVLNRTGPRADQIGFIRLEAVQRETVFLGINRHGADAHFGGGTENADGDFGAVGDKKFTDLGGHAIGSDTLNRAAAPGMVPL